MVDHKACDHFPGAQVRQRAKGRTPDAVGFLGYMHELCNFSNGKRTLAEIHRAMGHELTPVAIRDLVRIGQRSGRAGLYDSCQVNECSESKDERIHSRAGTESH